MCILNATFNEPHPGATITATQGAVKVSTVSDPDGGYAFHDLTDGAWQIDVTMSLFATQHR